MILAPINTTVTTTGDWTPVALPTGVDCEDFLVSARDAVAVKISNVAAGTTYFTIKANASISLNEILGPKAYLFYAQSITSGTVVEVLPLRRHRGN